MSGKHVRRPEGMDKEKAAKFKHKQNAYRGWKQWWVTWREKKDTVWTSRDEVKEAETQVKLKLARNIKDHKKGSYTQVKKGRLGILFLRRWLVTANMPLLKADCAW